MTAEGTTLVNVADVLGRNNIKIVPDVVVSGDGNGSLDGIAGVLMRKYTLKDSE